MRAQATLLLLLALSVLAGDSPTFTNPFVPDGADPWVLFHHGAYYHCFSGGDRVQVRRATRLHELAQAKPVTVWTPPRGKPYSKEIWAPELHFLDGKWWIYVAADDGHNENHRLWVLEGGADPMQPFTLKGPISTSPDRWAIDGTVVTIHGSRYPVWSGWDGTENVAQNLYIAAMASPWSLRGDRVCISKPTLPWELNGRPLINEGPEALYHGDKVFIVYSASGSWTDDYCLGLLEWTGGNPLDPASWRKEPQAVFSRTEKVRGPGHCSFVPSPDGRENWIVYHAAKRPGSGWDRNLRLQPFSWRPDGRPDFANPVDPGTPIAIPSGTSTR